MKHILIILLFASATAYSQKTLTRVITKDSTTITLGSWELEQVRQYDVAAKELEREAEQAAKLIDSNRQTFFKTLIGRDVTAQDSVSYSEGRIVIYPRKKP